MLVQEVNSYGQIVACNGFHDIVIVYIYYIRSSSRGLLGVQTKCPAEEQTVIKYCEKMTRL